ncbi:MAG: NAD(P)-dependent oxidoreductase [Nanoarchaeota archaeon]
MLKKVLIIGASSNLGAYLMKDFSRDYEVTGTYLNNKKTGMKNLNITDENQVAKIINKENPKIIILASAISNVEQCEKNQKKAIMINYECVRKIVNFCKNRKLIFYSTDAVFDGSKKEFKEQDEKNPKTIYGKSKSEAEEIIKTLPDYLIIRTARFYSTNKKNKKFINLVIGSLKEGKEITAPIETPGNPTLIDDVSRITLDLVKKDRKGIYHVAGPGKYSLYDTALKIAEIFKLNKSLIRKVNRDFNSPVPRVCSYLNTEKIQKEGYNLISLDDGLKKLEQEFK